MGTVTAVLTPAHSPLPLHHSNSKPVTAKFTLVLPQGNSPCHSLLVTRQLTLADSTPTSKAAAADNDVYSDDEDKHDDDYNTDGGKKPGRYL